jgi:hypothetical protein
LAEPAMLVFADTVDGPSAVGRSPLRRNVLIATTAAGVAVRPSPLQPSPFAPRPCSPHSSPLAPAALTPRSSPLQPSPLAPRPSPLPPERAVASSIYRLRLQLPDTVAASRYLRLQPRAPTVAGGVAAFASQAAATPTVPRTAAAACRRRGRAEHAGTPS